MKKINFEAGKQISPAKVTIDDVEHNVTPAVYEGNTPLSPFVLNTLQDNIENEFQVDKTTITGKTEQEGTPSTTNIVPIKNVNVYGVNELNIKSDYSNTSNGVTFLYDSVAKSFKCKGTLSSTNFYVTLNIEDFGYVFNANKKYIMSIDRTIPANLQARGSSGDIGTITCLETGATSIELTSEKPTGIRLYVNSATSGTKYDFEFKVKIEEGSTATPYTPYEHGFLDLNLQKDTDTKTVTLISKRLHESDSVDENGFNYNRETLVLNGTEDLELWGNGTSSSYRLIYKGATNIIKKDGLILSDYYTMKTANELYEGIAGITIDTSGNIIIHDSRFTTLEAWKTHLANQYSNGTPVTAEYKLAKEEKEQFNETNQTAWNTFENLLLKGYIFVNSSSDELQPTITLTEHTANEIHRENVERFKKLEERNIYSTEEIVIGKWINRKPLYRKVYEVSTPSALTFTKVITLDSTTKVTKCDIRVDATNGASFIVPYYSASDDFISSYIYDGVYLKVSKSNYQSLPCYITLEYTKTTD